jgi:hypothetical protein
MLKIFDSLEATVPNDLQRHRLAEIVNLVQKRGSTAPDAAEVVAGGIRGVLFRYVSCVDDAETFADSVAVHGAAVGWPERYRQDRALFGFFVNGTAAIDSLCYALFGVGATIFPPGFGVSTNSDLRQITMKATADAYKSHFPSEQVTAKLGALGTDQDYLDWVATRNVLAHRIHPARIFNRAVGAAPPQPPPPDALALPAPVDLNVHTTAGRRIMLAGWLNALADHGCAMCQRLL